MIGRRLGGYEITGPLGEGGMGVVYRATDSKLKREVAIKVLPEAFAADAERLARFEREAQLLAQLQHPNVASIYGLEEADGVRALVMELVEGEDLAERLKRGALPLDEALTVARQIAEALEAAHEKGIVHRDLKPANVKLTPGGTVKVLDFGLAKAMDPPGAASAADLARSPTLMNSPTMTAAHGTQLGVILGTAAYMSPEQARGGTVDKRADIWAFGVVLHEMLSGRSLFAADTVSDTLAGVLKNEIDLALLPASTPPALRGLLRRCLERNPKNRLHDIADARIVLDDVLAGRTEPGGDPGGGAGASAPRGRIWPARLALLGAGLLLGALGTALLLRTVLAPAPVEPPTLISLTYSGKDAGPSASPDGKTIAFTSARDGRSRIWLKQLATGEEVALTAGPSDSTPRFSPDGSTLLFLRGAAAPYGLFRVPTVGGEPRRIADGLASEPSWAPDGQRIALTRASIPSGVPDTLLTLSADGDDERRVALVTDAALLDVRWSPDGLSIGALTNLRTNFAAQQSIVAFDAASGKRRLLYQPAAGTLFGGWAWTGSGGLVVSEATTQSGRGGSRLRLVPRGGGPPETLLFLQKPPGRLDVAGPGRVVVEQRSPTQNLAEWPLDLKGPSGANGTPSRWLTRGASVDRQPVFSPDGTRLAFNSDRGGNLDIWELELATGAVRRLMVAAGDDWDPAYTRDGKHVLWSSNRSGNYEVWIAESDGGRARRLTDDGVDAENPTATPDGRWIVYASANPAKAGVWKARPDGSEAQLVVAGTLSVPELSPDGLWFSCIDTGNNLLRVVALSDGAEVATIALPPIPLGLLTLGRSRWIPGSSTLVWVDHDFASAATRLVAQEIAPGRDTSASRRTLLQGTLDSTPESFAVSPDRTRLLVSVDQSRSDLLLVDGLGGITR
jgi:Tol biopolymer transport system component